MRILISCGEASGDLYAGALAGEIMRRQPGAEVVGFGGPRLRAAGARLLGDFAEFSVTGLTEALRVLPRSLVMLRRLVENARVHRPDVFVPIDFPDFNFRLMAAMRRLDVPVVYYVSPQLWAWRPRRMRTMQRDVTRMLVIFPFEEAIYRNAGVDVRFVGHPLIDLVQGASSRETFLREHGLAPEAPTVALLPGSRRNELERIVPVMAEAMPRVRARVPAVQFTVACAPNLPEDAFAPLARVPRTALVHQRSDEVIASSDVAVTASGTATVQCALHERPMVVVYRLSALTYAVGKPFVKVNTYAMPNLVAGRTIVPELIQDGLTPSRVVEETVSLLTDTERHARTRKALRDVREQLGAPGASGRAAEAILEIARR